MTLKLLPFTKTEKSTISKLYVDDVFECYILEDTIRAVKVHGETAIPSGTYNVVITMSNRFKKPLPLLENVPNFSGIRIHSGNTSADSDGCLLTGTTVAKDFVGNSRIAFNKLFAKIKKALDAKEKVTIHINR